MTTRLIGWLDEWAGPVALQVAVAATLILVVALLVSWVLRRSAASLRHRVWALAILGLLAYPLVQPILPKLSLGLWVVSPERTADAQPAATNPAGSPTIAHHAALPIQNWTSVEQTAARTNPSAGQLPMSKPRVADDDGIRRPVAESSTQAFRLHWPSILAALWATGTVIGLGFLMKVHLAAWRLVRSATIPADSSWTELAGAVTAQLGVRRRVAVRISDRIAVPVTAGWLRPAILLPSGCNQWPGPRRRMVLIHEMSHVARDDVLWQIAAKLACAVYWPHPLVWLAARRMRVEREAACDDAVLRDVERPSEYASLLLDVAASLADRPIGMSTAVAMACGRSVEERIRWIVEPGRCRLPVGRRTARWFSVGAILLVLGLGSISIFAGPPAPAASEPTADGQKSYQERLQRAELATPGHVADLQGQPIANAIVKRKDTSWTATTDADGSFPMPDLKIGETTSLSVSARGFLSTSQSIRIELGITNTGVEYVVSGGWPIELARPASISGRVLGPDGKPLADAPLSIDTWVHLRGVNATTGNYAQTKTDAEGRFTLADIPPGSHVIYYPGNAAAKGICGALPVTPTDGQKITGMVLDLSNSTAGVDGLVFGPDGQPMAGAHVTASWVPPWKTTGGSTGPYPTSPVTDQDGRYKLAGLAPGKWRVGASDPRYQRTQPWETVTVADSQTAHQDLRIFQRYERQNQVTRAAAESERTNDLSKLEHVFYSIGIQSADNSLDKFNRLPVVDLSDGAANQRIIDIKPLGLPANATPEQMAAAAHIGELYFRAPDKLVTIGGTIVAPFTPPADRNRSYFGDMTRAEIAIQVEKCLQRSPQSDGRRVTIHEGETYIVVRADQSAYQMQVTGVRPDGASLTFFYLGPLPLNYPADPSQSNVISGRVTDEQGRPIEGALVRAHSGMGTLFVSAKTDSDRDGRYVLRYPKTGEFEGTEFSASKPGFAVVSRPTNTDFVLARAPTASVEEKAVDRPASSVPANSAKGPILRGRIVDESGSPLPGVNVVLYSGFATRWRGQETKTNANGEYRFDPLKTGSSEIRDGRPSEWYTGVQFEHDEYVPADGRSWRDIQVPMVDRHEHVLDMKMVRGGKVSGIVVDAETGKPAGKLGLRIHNGFVNGKDSTDFLVYSTTDASGRFTSRPLFPGRYVIDINGSYAKIGTAVVRAGETTQVQLTISERPDLQDPFRINGTAVGDDGHSMVYGGVGLRITGSDNKLRTAGGGIDGRNVFSLNFGPIERITPSPKAPYGVGTYDVELFGWNSRFGYKLVKRMPSEPLRITDDPNQPELKDGVRYIRPNQPVEFQLMFAKDDAPQRQSSENASAGAESPEDKPVAAVARSAH